ncbi:hypothetical protein PybrP1_005298 [[Pythium] brassicae (nom. inval.)]|nr:hypothetical protein PybrP1_005298 [[Pythium] brassicae (nom. inval.)]
MAVVDAPKQEGEEEASAAVAAVLANAVAWRRALRLLLRRFSGRLLVRGRLLNPHELLVTRVRRTDVRGQPLVGESAVSVPHGVALRVAVRCEDGAERVGREVVALVRHAVIAFASANEEGDADADVLPEAQSVALSSSAWDDAQLLTARDSLFGFDVRSLVQLSASHLPDDSATAANALLAAAPAFNDLRCTRLLMRDCCGAEWLQQHGTVQSLVMEKRNGQPLVADEAHPRSYISLGQAQKRRWADERFDVGKELVANGRLKDALVEFTNCLKLDETHVAAQFARGEAHAALQQFSDAVSDFELVQKLDGAFAGLDAALSRVRGKQSHSRRVNLPTSALPGRPAVPAMAPSSVPGTRASAVGRSPSKQLSGAHSSSSAAVEQFKRLEKDRLQRLLEAEVGARREKRERHRRREVAGKDSGGSDSDSDAYRKRRAKKKKKKEKTKKKKAKSTTKTHKRPRAGVADSDGDDGDDDDDRDATRSSSRKRKEAKRRRRSNSRRRSRSRSRHQRRDSASSDSSVVSGGSSSERSRSGCERRRKRDRRRQSADRPEKRSASFPATEELHPILARPRHRIWN